MSHVRFVLRLLFAVGFVLASAQAAVSQTCTGQEEPVDLPGPYPYRGATVVALAAPDTSFLPPTVGEAIGPALGEAGAVLASACSQMPIGYYTCPFGDQCPVGDRIKVSL